MTRYNIKKNIHIGLGLTILALLYFAVSVNYNISAGDRNPQSPVVSVIQSDLSGITITVTYDSNYAHDVYIVETGSDFLDTSKDIIEKGADRGLIQFPCTGEVISKYVIVPSKITTVIKTKYDMSVYDRTDFVFTHDSLYIINTTQTNAGLYFSSNIYVLPSLDSKFEYEAYLNGSSACNLNKKLLMQILDFCMKNEITY